VIKNVYGLSTRVESPYTGYFILSEALLLVKLVLEEKTVRQDPLAATIPTLLQAFLVLMEPTLHPLFLVETMQILQ